MIDASIDTIVTNIATVTTAGDSWGDTPDHVCEYGANAQELVATLSMRLLVVT